MTQRATLGLTLTAVAVAALSLFAFRIRREREPPVERIILITIDALRADRLGCYGYRPAATSPVIDALASQSLVFDRAFAQAPWTVPSMGSLMSGHYALDAGAYTNNGDIVVQSATLAERLQRAGYRTAFFNANPLLWRRGIQRGFDSVAPVPVGEKIPYTSIEPLVMAWLERHAQEKFFLWIHNMDTHQPATVGNSYLNEPGWERYDAEVRWVDEALGRLLAKLGALGIRDKLLLIFTADHGEAFEEHGLAGHQDVIYDEVLRVPLIVHLDGMKGQGHIREPVQVLDLNPTVLELAGLEPTTRSGESLAPLVRGEIPEQRRAFSSRYYFDRDFNDPRTGRSLFARGQHHLAVHDSKWALIAKVRATSTDPRTRPDWNAEVRPVEIELYDTDRDPLEMHNLAATQPEVAAELESVLVDWKLTRDALVRDAQTSDDPATHEAMHMLGYEH